MRQVLAIIGTALASCGPAFAETSEHSVLDEISELRPAIACMADHVSSSSDESGWRGGVPFGPATNSSVLSECSKLGGLSEAPISEQEGIEELKSIVFMMAIWTFGDARDHLTAEDFDRAIELAACIEKMTLADESAFAQAETLYVSTRAAQLSCGFDIMKLAESPDRGSRADVLGFQISNVNIGHIGRVLGVVQQLQAPREIGSDLSTRGKTAAPPAPPMLRSPGGSE